MSDHFIAGTAAGVGGLTAAYPLDTAKIRIQCNPSKYRNGIDCLRVVYRTEGIAAWYRGLLAPVLGYGAINAAVFGVYGWSATRLKRYRGVDESHTLSSWEVAVCGGHAGLWQSLVRAPVERIKTICQNTGDKGSVRCVLDVVKREGPVNGLMRGLMATIYRETPQYMIYFPVYQYLRSALSSSSSPAPWVNMIAGGAAGCLMWMPPIYSIDVIKSRIQAAPGGTYKGFWDCTIRTYRAHGTRVFVDGLGVALMRAFPLHGSIFVIYEVTMSFLRPRNPP